MTVARRRSGTRDVALLKGRLLGWAPPVQRAIRAQASRGLDAFIVRHGLGPR